MIYITAITETGKKKITKFLASIAAAAAVASVFAVIPKAINLIPTVPIRDFSAFSEKTDMPIFASGVYKGEEDHSPDPEASEEEDISYVAQDGDMFVTASNLCWYGIGEKATLDIINKTKYKVDPNDFLKREYPITAENTGTEPLVLIVHTHGSESYLETGKDFYGKDETFRSDDPEKTVVHIGDLLCKALNEKGVAAVHDRTMYDTEDFNKSYTFSKKGIEEMLVQYPTVKYVIDLHRDSIFNSKGENIKPVTEINGKRCAQIMFVIGTDEGGSGHTGWRDNFTFAAYLENEINRRFPTLARPINLRTAAFNQMLTKGSIILECGACGNTVEEAENAVLFFAEAYAELLKKH